MAKFPEGHEGFLPTLGSELSLGQLCPYPCPSPAPNSLAWYPEEADLPQVGNHHPVPPAFHSRGWAPVAGTMGLKGQGLGLGFPYQQGDLVAYPEKATA